MPGPRAFAGDDGVGEVVIAFRRKRTRLKKCSELREPIEQFGRLSAAAVCVVDDGVESGGLLVVNPPIPGKKHLAAAE